MKWHPLCVTASLVFGAVLITEDVNPAAWYPPVPVPYSASAPSMSPVLNTYVARAIVATPPHPWIALTFDDGPHPRYSEELLQVLAQQSVPATFFVVGKMAERYPYLVREIADAGHEVANHTYSHLSMTSLSDAQVLEELDRTRAVIRSLTGTDSFFYRPPGGNFSRHSARRAAQAGYHMVLWDTQTKDVGGASQDTIRRRILEHAVDGDIVLMHSGVRNTLSVLPSVIEELRAKGYHFVTISTLLSDKSTHS